MTGKKLSEGIQMFIDELADKIDSYIMDNYNNVNLYDLLDSMTENQLIELISNCLNMINKKRLDSYNESNTWTRSFLSDDAFKKIVDENEVNKDETSKS